MMTIVCIGGVRSVRFAMVAPSIAADRSRDRPAGILTDQNL